MSNDSGLSLPTQVLLRAVLNISLVWFMARYMNQYIEVTGGFTAYLTVGALLTLLNLFVRPLLAIIAFPFKLFATILALIIVNGIFVQLVHVIVQNMRPDVVTLEIYGGLWGWIVVAAILGFGNWLMKLVVK